MKLIAKLICAGGLWAITALAQSPVTLTVDTQAPGVVIPDDFIGMSFEMEGILPDENGAHFLSATNKPLVTLFQNLGIRHIRAGGGSVDSPPSLPIPGYTEIDNLFAFAWAAGVDKVIYTLRLLETDYPWEYATTNIALAKYVWKHYRLYLDTFALGNEPNRGAIYQNQDLTIVDFATFLTKWRKYAAIITNAVPEARFSGPDGGSANVLWTDRFANAEKNLGLVTMITEHLYVGAKGKGVNPEEGISMMLSPDWLETNQALYEKVVVPVMADGFPYRFTEANDFYSGGVRGASDTCAGALWALDYLHWWAAHGASGADFHNKLGNVNDVIARNAEGQLKMSPKGYGLKAFDLGGHGRVEPVAISNPDGVNLTAYAVRGASNLFVTIINKSYGDDAHAMDVTILSDGITNRAEAIYLTAPNGDVAAENGVTLGGAPINRDGPWLGKWTPLAPGKAGQCAVKVAAASAAVVKIATQ